MTTAVEIPDDRDLTAQELSLVSWLLQHGGPEAIDFVSQLANARVASRCYCGCASVNFAINGVESEPGTGITILSDYEWGDADGRIFGAFVFKRSGLLAGLEIWSQDGLAIADTLPNNDQLRPIGTGQVSEQSSAKELLIGSVSNGEPSLPV